MMSVMLGEGDYVDAQQLIPLEQNFPKSISNGLWIRLHAVGLLAMIDSGKRHAQSISTACNVKINLILGDNSHQA